MTPLQRRLAEQLEAALPQTQCTRCGEPDCRRYAQAIAQGHAPINRCPPGGEEGVARLAALTGQAPLPLDPAFGQATERRVARIDENWCIGCTLCIKACPVDAIVGAPKFMHTVLEDDCTGCELCIPACPVDCIEMPTATPGLKGWAAWSPAQAQGARARYQARGERLQREAREAPLRLAAKGQDKLQDLAAQPQDAQTQRKRAVVQAAIARAREKAKAKA